jgi:sortase A
MSRLLGFVGRTLIVAGLFILGFAAYQLWGTGLEEGRNQDELTSSLARTARDRAGVAVNSATVDLDALARALSKVDPATAPASPPPAEGEPVGVIEIPRIDLQRVVVQGVAKADLKKGPGHYPGTPLPGQKGNSGIAGHRTTYGAPFNRIDEIRPGDKIIITTEQGRFTYTAITAPGSDQAWYVVSPEDVSVLEDKGDNRITLTACHPKYSAKQRIIVNAVLDAEPAPTSPADARSERAARQASAQFDESLTGDASSLPIALAFGVGALVVGILAWFVGSRWRRWPTYLLAAPVIAVLIWYCYVYLDRTLPAL